MGITARSRAPEAVQRMLADRYMKACEAYRTVLAS
jgi:hypothetical protein